jgi:uncharacterized protein YbjQ (UPF0145 family)
MSDFAVCINCHTELTETITVIPEERVKAIHYFTTDQSPGYCTKCYQRVVSAATVIAADWIDKLSEQLEKDLVYIPILTLQSPAQWDYDVKGLVTAQSATIVGALADLIFGIGLKVPRTQNKIKRGEDIGIARLKYEAAIRGGNAVIAMDIDYQATHIFNDMIMICMSGTAIKVKNTEVFTPDALAAMERNYKNTASLDDCLKYSSILTPSLFNTPAMPPSSLPASLSPKTGPPEPFA